MGLKWSGCCAEDIGASTFPSQQREQVQEAVVKMKRGLAEVSGLELHSGDDAEQNACKEVVTALDAVAATAGRLDKLH